MNVLDEELRSLIFKISGGIQNDGDEEIKHIKQIFVDNGWELIPPQNCECRINYICKYHYEKYTTA